MDILPGLAHSSNVHPMFVHFPMVLWIVALGFFAFGAVRRSDDLVRMGRWFTYLGLVGAAAAVATGLWAEEQLGHHSPGHGLVHVHRNWMLVASALGGLTAVAAFFVRKRADATARWAFFAVMFVVTGVTLLGADRGAELVYRYGVGTGCDVLHPADEHQHGAEPTLGTAHLHE